MSFNPYDMIHAGNYESFFLLYIDQELDDAQMKMVDEFLSAHPELQSEFDLLMSTRLPVEHFSFDKESLMAENMYPGSVAEDLLLYMDDELPADKKNIIEFELASNKDYQQQFESLKLTKLDASEIIEYPNKKELYRRTDRVIAFRPWMRVAAAVVVIVISGVVYLQKPGQPEVTPFKTASTKNDIQKPVDVTKSHEKNVEVAINSNPLTEKTAIKNTEALTKKDVKKKDAVIQQDNQNLIASNNITAVTPDRNHSENPLTKVSSIPVEGQAEAITKSVAATLNPVLKTINKPGVTSDPAERTPNIASNDKKGSVKGFLRKATRLIEKRTGIDPTNENGELLIGMVAVNLK